MSGYGHGGTVVHGGPAYGGYGYYSYPIGSRPRDLLPEL